MDEREKLLLKYVKGKKVLDMGVGDIGHRFLHKFVSSQAKKAKGIELSKERADNLRKMGYDVEVGNAETFKINDKFDVIIAGDLIEHLNNPGLMLDSVKKHLRENGLFVFNTPNIYSINFLLRGLFNGGEVKQFNEHSLGFTEQLIRELLQRHGFEVKEIKYFNHKEKNLKSRAIRSLSRFVPKWRENIWIVAKVKKQ
jgi:2-polyprenyl-3-methyl-5-hydroxy-6-metoxy-1,4-benzoquinol methylase